MSSIDPGSGSSVDPSSPAETPASAARKTQPSSNLNILIFGLIMLAGILFLAWIGRPTPIVTIGRALPQLDLHPLTAGTPPISLETLKGKVTVLHFWGTWCAPCEMEFPEFTKLANRLADNPQVAIVSVSCTSGPEYDLQALHDQTVAFMSAHGATMPTYSDPSAMTRYQISLLLPNSSMGYPTTLLIDREGKIFKVLDGYYSGDMEKLIPAIEGKL